MMCKTIYLKKVNEANEEKTLQELCMSIIYAILSLVKCIHICHLPVKVKICTILELHLIIILYMERTFL